MIGIHNASAANCWRRHNETNLTLNKSDLLP